MSYKEIQADLFTQIRPGASLIIPHVVNNKGAWGAGFVVPLGKRFPAIKDAYLRDGKQFRLGDIQWEFTDEPDIIAVNMFAQTLGGDRPLNYEHLVDCMVKVHYYFPEKPILAPKFGSGLAGGNWEFIRELIHDIWVSKGHDVTICYL